MNNNNVEWLPVRGNTYPVKDRLKRECQARYEADDKFPGKKVWMVPATFFPLAQSILGVTSTSTGTSDAVPQEAIVWSDEQALIVEWFRSSTVKGVVVKNLVVRARAGTGKTFTIVGSLRESKAKTILYVVFGKRNQVEASEKIFDPRITVLTLHAAGFRCIKRVWANVRVEDDNPQIEWDRLETVAGQVPSEVGGEILKLVGFAKNTFIGVPTFEAMLALAEDQMIECEAFEKSEDGGWTVGRLAEVAVEVLKVSMLKDSLNRISFNDMVWLPVAMNWVHPTYEDVVVDECQDMNAPQLEMAFRLTINRMCVVGDDRQAIFGFRGAVEDGIDMMKAKLNAGEVGLTVTRRCGIEIVEEAQRYVPDFKSAPGSHHATIDEQNQHDMTKAARPGDAILSRINAPLMALCLGFIREGIAARIEGRDVGAQLHNTIKRLKARSIPEVLRKSEAWGARMIKRAGKNETKIQTIQDTVLTIAALVEGLSSINEIEARVRSIFADSQKGSNKSIVCSSVHKAKGLEWNRVFVMGDTFKFNGSQEDNLRYVAVTRAKRHLTFVGSKLNPSTEKN